MRAAALVAGLIFCLGAVSTPSRPSSCRAGPPAASASPGSSTSLPGRRGPRSRATPAILKCASRSTAPSALDRCCCCCGLGAGAGHRLRLLFFALGTPFADTMAVTGRFAGCAPTCTSAAPRSSPWASAMSAAQPGRARADRHRVRHRPGLRRAGHRIRPCALRRVLPPRGQSVALLDGAPDRRPPRPNCCAATPFAGGQEALVVLLIEWERWSAEILESHISYPILCYYRSQHDNQSWLSALTAVLDSCALLISVVPGVASRQAQLTFAMARHALVDLGHVFHLEKRRRRGAPAAAPTGCLPPNLTASAT
jgi:hypothetical protein